MLASRRSLRGLYYRTAFEKIARAPSSFSREQHHRFFGCLEKSPTPHQKTRFVSLLEKIVFNGTLSKTYVVFLASNPFADLVYCSFPILGVSCIHVLHLGQMVLPTFDLSSLSLRRNHVSVANRLGICDAGCHHSPLQLIA